MSRVSHFAMACRRLMTVFDTRFFDELQYYYIVTVVLRKDNEWVRVMRLPKNSDRRRGTHYNSRQAGRNPMNLHSCFREKWGGERERGRAALAKITVNYNESAKSRSDRWGTRGESSTTK